MMKKELTILIALLCLWMGVAQAQNIHMRWRNKPIAVENGGENPTVIQLLKAFNKVWHYKATDALLAEAGDKRYVSNDSTEGNSGRAFVDCEDFCHCWYDFEKSDSHMVEARTYHRDNGHLLFAVCLAEAGPKGKYFCCFYDYNPKTSKMTPEDEPYITYRMVWPGSRVTYALGYEYDQTILLIATTAAGTEYHHFVFNGMKHKYDHSDSLGYASPDEDEGGEDE